MGLHGGEGLLTLIYPEAPGCAAVAAIAAPTCGRTNRHRSDAALASRLPSLPQRQAQQTVAPVRASVHVRNPQPTATRHGCRVRSPGPRRRRRGARPDFGGIARLSEHMDVRVVWRPRNPASHLGNPSDRMSEGRRRRGALGGCKGGLATLGTQSPLARAPERRTKPLLRLLWNSSPRQGRVKLSQRSPGNGEHWRRSGRQTRR